MKKNNNIELLRAILILLIIVYHYTYRFSEIYNLRIYSKTIMSKLGNIGVTAFFIISSYFMFKVKNYNFKNYLLKKIMRIWPSYFICVTIIFMSCQIFGLPLRDSNIKDYLLNIFFINGIIKTPYVDGAHWFLSRLLIFFVYSAVILLLEQNKNNKVADISINILKLLILIVCKFLTFDKLNSFLEIIAFDYIVFWILGLLEYKVISKEKKHISICFLICMLSIYLEFGIVIMFTSFVFFYLILFLIKNNELCKYPKVFIYIGNISFILFLIHQNIGYQILLFLYHHNFYNYFSIFLVVIFMIIISSVFYELIEKKIQLFLKNKFKY